MIDCHIKSLDSCATFCARSIQYPMSEVSVSNKSFDRDSFMGHPKGLYVCFFTEMWERFSFYGMKALLLLYLVKYHLFTDANGYNLLGAYGGLVYAVPVLGGLVADRWLGMRKSVLLGGVLLCLGHFGMALEGHQATVVGGDVVQDERALQFFYFSLALIITGVGFLKPNISTIVGRLYPENDPRRDSGFTIFYAGINLGAFIAPLLCGWLGETYGWKYGFGLAGVGMVAGLFVFIFGQKHFHGHAEPRDPEKLRQKVWGLFRLETVIYGFSIVGVFAIWGLVQTHSLMLMLSSWLPPMSPVILAMHTVTICLLTYILWFLAKQCNPVERHRMLVLFVLILGGLAFFTLYEQTYGSWILFSDRLMNREAFGIEWSASQLSALGAMFILILSPLFAWAWPRLEKRGLNPGKPMKTAIGMLLAAFSFWILIYSIDHPQANGLISLWWLVLAYLVLEMGELTLSPIALSAVTQLSVPRVVSLMMGAWFLGTSYAEVLAAQLAKLSVVHQVAETNPSVAQSLSGYQDLFSLLFWIGLGCGIVLVMLSPVLNRGMHGVK
jgi:POT family proton-dependent oligopeptide transporter